MILPGKIEPKKEGGVWVCPVCGFSAFSRELVERHIEREHGKGVEKKAKRFKDGDYLPFKDREVVVVLRNGAIVEGKLVYASDYVRGLEGATIKGTKNIAKVNYVLVHKSVLVMVHEPPVELRPKKKCKKA